MVGALGLRGRAYATARADASVGPLALAVALLPATLHPIWTFARFPDAPVSVLVGAVVLELSLMAGLSVSATALARADRRGGPTLRPLGLAQAPALLYAAGLLPPLRFFEPLLALALLWRAAATFVALWRGLGASPLAAGVAVVLGVAGGGALAIGLLGALYEVAPPR